MCIIHTHCPCFAIFNKGELVQGMDNFPRDGRRKDGMSLLEVAVDNLNGHATNIIICMPLQEGLDVLAKPFVWYVSMQEADPQHCCLRPRHKAFSLVGHWFV